MSLLGILETSRLNLTDEECWPWQGSISGQGYALYSNKSVSRILYRMYIGELAGGQMVRHICDNPPCVNWNHFLAGTHQDNMNDMTSRKRQAVGERNGGAKLHLDDVLAIREAYAGGGRTMRSLARTYDVSIYTISVIVNRKKWKHTP